MSENPWSRDPVGTGLGCLMMALSGTMILLAVAIAWRVATGA